MGQIVECLCFTGPVSSIKHDLWNLGVNKSPADLLLHPLAERISPKVESRIGRVNLRINRERLTIVQTEPVLEDRAHSDLLVALIR